MVTITFLPNNKKIKVKAGTSLLDAATKAGLAINSACGGKGTCGKCKVQISKGSIINTAAKDLSGDFVLACQSKVESDLSVDIPEAAKETFNLKEKISSDLRTIKIEPMVFKKVVLLKKPEIDDQTPDRERLLKALKNNKLNVKLPVLSSLPTVLRKDKGRVTAAITGTELISVEAGNTEKHLYGLALDIGTTTVMGALINLRNAEVLSITARTNRQIVYGADVISRADHAANTKNGLSELQTKVIETINEITGAVLKETGIKGKHIYQVVAVGNTIMSHLFFGVTPAHLIVSPFIPVFRKATPVRASELGITINPAASVVTLPNIAGYVGSDAVAAILATALDSKIKPSLLIDIGTNGEIVLINKGKIYACSTAAGPAFEGAIISQGMRAAEGAIAKVSFLNDHLQVETVNNLPAKGICGSGLIDAASALLDAGIINNNGSFISPEKEGGILPPVLASRLRKTNNEMEFVLAQGEEADNGKAITITQKDLRELQLAKGAISSGIEMLLKKTGIEHGDLDRIYLAGAFGSNMDIINALRIGLLPPLIPEKIIPVGNAAGNGAMMALISTAQYERALALASSVLHIELSSQSDFQEHFIASLKFP